MGLYTNTVTTTWANLRTTLAALTANTSVTISDPNNVIFAPMTSSPSTGTCFGDIIYSATPSTVLVDFSDNDFSANTNVTDASSTDTYPYAGWFGIICSDTISYFCTRLSGMGKLPTITTSGYQMFYGCTSLASIDASAFTNVTDASFMFNNCTSLASITGTAAFTNVTNASYMFQGCTSLASIDTTAFTNVTNAREMFQGCTSLASIDTSAFTNVTNASYMFNNCTSLASITGTAAFTNVTNAERMFQSCTSLASIDTTAFTNVTNAICMFYGCTSLTKIYMLNNIFSLASEPTSNNYFMISVPTSCVFCVMPSSYSTWYTRLYTNYAKWGLSAAKTPTTVNLIVYHRVA